MYTVEAETAEELMPYVNGLTLHCQVMEFSQWLRTYVKHDGVNNNKTKQDVAEHIQMMMYDIINMEAL